MITEQSKYAFCKVSISPVRSEQRDASEMISQLLFGEPVEIIEFNLPWTKIQSLSDGYIGFVDHKQLISISEKELKKWLNELSRENIPTTIIDTPWGMQRISCGSFVSDEPSFQIGKSVFQRLEKYSPISTNIYDFSTRYLNTPYLWGGKSILGIDCSGFTQCVLGAFDIKLPRDAYQQQELGESVSYKDKKNGDLAFFSNENGKVIHVGLIGEKNEIIHASGCVRKDELKSDGIYSNLNGLKTHNLHSIRRYK
jgi:hypothetical protein